MAIRQLNIECRTYYFYNDLINIKNFNNYLKLDKKSVFVYNKKNHSRMLIV